MYGIHSKSPIPHKKELGVKRVEKYAEKDFFEHNFDFLVT